MPVMLGDHVRIYTYNLLVLNEDSCENATPQVGIILSMGLQRRQMRMRNVTLNLIGFVKLLGQSNFMLD